MQIGKSLQGILIFCGILLLLGVSVTLFCVANASSHQESKRICDNTLGISEYSTATVQEAFDNAKIVATGVLSAPIGVDNESAIPSVIYNFSVAEVLKGEIPNIQTVQSLGTEGCNPDDIQPLEEGAYVLYMYDSIRYAIVRADSISPDQLGSIVTVDQLVSQDF